MVHTSINYQAPTNLRKLSNTEIDLSAPRCKSTFAKKFFLQIMINNEMIFLLKSRLSNRKKYLKKLAYNLCKREILILSCMLCMYYLNFSCIHMDLFFLIIYF